MYTQPVIMSKLDVRKLKAQQLIEAKSRLERKRKEARCWRLYLFLKGFTVFALFGTIAANGVTIHHSLFNGAAASNSDGFSLFADCSGPDGSLPSGTAHKGLLGSRQCELVRLDIVAVRALTSIVCFVLVLHECDVQAVAANFKALGRPIVKAFVYGLVATVTSSARAPLLAVAASWGNLATAVLAACAACRLVADLAYTKDLRMAQRSRKRWHSREASKRGARRDRSRRQGETKGELPLPARSAVAGAKTSSNDGERQRLRIEVGAPSNVSQGGVWGMLEAWRDRLAMAPLHGGGNKGSGAKFAGNGGGKAYGGSRKSGATSASGGFSSGPTSAVASSVEGLSDDEDSGEVLSAKYSQGSDFLDSRAAASSSDEARYKGGYGARLYGSLGDNDGARSRSTSGEISPEVVYDTINMSSRGSNLNVAGVVDEESDAVGLFAAQSPIKGEGRGRSWEARDPEGTLDLDI